MRRRLGLALCLIIGFFCAWPARAATLDPDKKARVRAIVAEVRAKAPVPSISVAIVVGGELAYAEAFGLADLEPARPATPATRYDIGSVSKQFTAAAVMLMVQDGKLSLDDKVSRYFPKLAGAETVTIRQLLSHTAGYREYWQGHSDEMRSAIAPQALVDRWGAQPLAFAPGSTWDYSNTNYMIAGRIVETVAGQPLIQLLTERVFKPLGMTSAIDSDGLPPTPLDAGRFTRNLLGPARRTDNPPRGWAFAAGGLSMTASDLARWDASFIKRSLLAPASYDALTRDTVLTDGKGAGYGLGLYVDGSPGHRRVHHNGFAPGVITENRIYLDDGVALVVTTNAEFSMVAPQIIDRLETLLLAAPFAKPTTYSGPDAAKPPKPPSALIRAYVSQLRAGRLDRRRLTLEASAYFTPQVLTDYRDSLARLGPPIRFVTLSEDRIEGMNTSQFELSWPGQKMLGAIRVRDDGKVADLWLMAL